MSYLRLTYTVTHHITYKIFIIISFKNSSHAFHITMVGESEDCNAKQVQVQECAKIEMVDGGLV
jgi:hypothetical protein